MKLSNGPVEARLRKALGSARQLRKHLGAIADEGLLGDLWKRTGVVYRQLQRIERSLIARRKVER